MKIRRYKKVHRHLNFYKNNFGFREPYQILVDGTFCFAALNNQINIADNLPRYVGGEIKLLTTQCAIIEMENLSPKLRGALIILKKYAVHKCGHDKKPISGASCLLSMLGKSNEKHYLIATQDKDLQNQVRNLAAVPLLYLHSKTPVLEQPSKVSVEMAKSRLIGLSTTELEVIEKVKQKNLENSQDLKPKKRKRKGGPNPLSCKKKKKRVEEGKVLKTTEGKVEREKKRRKKIRIPQHVKEELIKNKT